NASFGGIAIHNKGIILDCNRGLSEITGYEYDELIGMDGLLLISEKSRENVMSNILAGYERPYEAFGVRKNGQEYPLRLEARNIPYKGKQVRVVEFRDITDQKKAELEAQYNRELLELNTDNMFDLVALTDLNGNFEFAGKSHSMLGYDHDYLIGRNVLEFVHPEDQHRIASEFKDFVQSKDDGRKTEFRYRCRDGTYLWLETIGKTVQQTDFHPGKLLFSSRDITSRKQKEEELRKSRQALDKQIRLLNGFLENAPDILSIKRPDLTVIRYNKAGYEFLGKSPEDVHGNKCYELLGRQTNCDNCASIDAIRTKKPVFREKYVSELDTYFSCRANPVISENGNIEYIVEIIRDITERKRTEEMQRIFFQMLQNSEHIAVFKDPSLKYVLINNAYTKLTGHTLPQVIGKTDKELFQGISTPEQIQEY
ncbi:PAS domain S-box protein, partial [Methanosalsum natronophilum]